MQRILIRHLSGARANQVDEFPITEFHDIVVGRDPAANVRFDADRDDLVSRQHVKIILPPGDPLGFQLVDLQSRNGSFVNRHRVYGAARLIHNDIVQLGPSGPEFRFEIDPPPMQAAEVSRETDSSVSGPVFKPTREFEPVATLQPAPVDSPRPVGRATVERMLGDTFSRVKRESNKSVRIGVAILFVLLVAGGGVWWLLRQSAEESKAASERSQQSIQAVNQSLQKSPAELQSMRDEVARLSAQLQAAETKNREELKALNRNLSAQSAERARMDREARAQSQSLPNFGTLLIEASQLIDQKKGNEALAVAQRLIHMDQNRWEGWALGGLSAAMTDQYALASTMLQQAVAKAPPDQRPKFEELLKKTQQSTPGAQ